MNSSGPQRVLAGGGEMGALMRSIDWSHTPVGPVEGWPQSLRTALSILLETGFPMYIAWGPEYTQFYNDGYRPILGSTKHPHAMGRSTRESFPEIWTIIGPMFERVMEGTPTTLLDFMLRLDRYGFLEECYFVFSYSPIRDEEGEVGGILVTVTETTERVLSERRLRLLQALAEQTRDARTVMDVCGLVARLLASEPADLPMVRMYLLESSDQRAVLASAAGETLGPGELSDVIDLTALDDPYGVRRAIATKRRQVSERLPESFRATHGGAVPSRLVALPIVRPGDEAPLGVLLVVTSAGSRLTEAYLDFLALFASQIGGTVAAARALEDAQARADDLAEVNRAKTAFFNNISHEFRTPLTLMIGPAEQALAQESALAGDELDAVHRNALRLLKLTNTLLDFSRLEAGRVEATFEPTDLSAMTRELAGAFRSTIERAGVHFVVDAPDIPVVAFVDRDMWEKIVLNLISNAFKFTARGAIHVSLSEHADRLLLIVRDTGAGIAAADLRNIFQRFYRAETTTARTHEGSGIGLALVGELVAMHAGTIAVESELGQGATFTVSVPAGCAHLPPERVRHEPRAVAPYAPAARPYVAEAMRWTAVTTPAPADARPPAHAGRILVADDNADMRDYLTRLLSDRWVVECVSNGADALVAIRDQPPDLLITDVMMPVVDGFELLRHLRRDERTRGLPIMLLSARAGEAAQVDGLTAGADDYLVKPFSARELIARIDAQLARARLRSMEEAHTLRLASVFAHAPVGVAILRGPDHVFEFANRPYLELVGRRAVVGRPIRAALPELIPQGTIDLLDDVYASGEPYVGRSVRLVLEQRGDAAEEAFFDFVYQPLFDDGGAVTGIAIVAFEVTQLAAARRDAESANRAKDEFLAMLGHELRNPLAPILTALQLMQLRGIEGAERERSIIERQVRHMVGLVDDLLDISRITRGKVQLKKTRVDLADLVAKAVEMTAPAIEERRHGLKIAVSRGFVLDADASRLAQVIANLLTNAAKYTDPGGQISIEAGRHEGCAVLRVIDTGIGIAPEMLPRVFDLFSQERQNIDRSEGGLGLGLAIVRSLVQAHGGTVSARSDGKGKGSEFQLRIPLAAGESRITAPRPDPAQSAAVTARRVLVVDDNSDAAELLADCLIAMGHTARVAFDGPTAIELARIFLPEVALLDLGLPVMDGFELAERLRLDPGLIDVRLIALTGYGQELDRQRTAQAGFEAHMVKPVDIATLDEWLRKGPETRG